MNKLGDNQMVTYFRSGDNRTDYGGMACEGDTLFVANTSKKKIFGTIKKIHEKSHQEHGGAYFQRNKRERTCAIRLPPNRFFEVF